METFHEDVRLQMHCKICDKELPTVGGNTTGMRNYMRTVGF